MSEFTPAPWHVVGSAEEFNLSVCAERPGNESRLDSVLVDANAEANARLIAAAPLLYSDAEFLCARIRELEGEMSDDDELSRQYFGHVLPAIARMESALVEARESQGNKA